ncbi:multidrug efflux transporter transcriptional repressor AcrR [Shimwellia pseudoproteus]|uniref:multidrug efflux transporter transcriptional repressor AcrR n=1 Tax=Shimwellia pseudoproteus TaxID=570012 RepID=UPI0018EBF0BC|nr:multidrug efflux transporter transcriptional repressor AcrR [Shimwellia pseudoproteus]MBJ3814647.1 multidrug efflux transporter transcriptional repressor AcrR [Shimwellia pseudoproteus]
MARKTKQQALETKRQIIDVAIRLFSQQGVSATSLADIAKAAGVTRGAIYWHFRNKSDLFNEIWQSSGVSISDVELEYQAKYPDDPLRVMREILIYILQATVVEERRRLMMEILFHKCEFVGEMTAARDAQLKLCMEGYDRIGNAIQRCTEAGMLPADLHIHRAAVLMRSYVCGLMENWLFAPHLFDLKEESSVYVDIFIEMLQRCPSVRQADSSAEKIG